MQGIDCAVPLTESKAKSLAELGKGFVCRYLVPEQYAWKRLTRTEAEIITKAGMNIVSVFQRGTSDAKGGETNGIRDGKAAYQEAKLIGQPEGTAIYFAVDYDAQPQDYNNIEAYLRAAAKQLPGYNVGVYGSYFVVEEMFKRGACRHFWQTYAWSKGKLSRYANIYQYKNGVTLAGHQVDLNESFGNEGWWNTMPTKKTNYVDVEAGRWSEDAIAMMKEIGVMGGYEDGTFRPAQPLTREEYAAATSRLLEYIKKNLK